MRVGRPLVRFVDEASFLVVVAAVPAVLTPSWIAIGVILAGALLLGIGLERHAAGREQWRPVNRRGRRARAGQPTAAGRPAATAVLPPESEHMDEPREWNTWERDRLARDGAGVDEERGLVPMNLRDFAGGDRLLPPSFHDHVRESFGELVAVGSG